MIETHCTACGDAFTPSHDAYVRGDWRTCTRCRGDPGEQAPGVILDDSRVLGGEINGPKCQAGQQPGKDQSWT